jgi:hypothetical protein
MYSNRKLVALSTPFWTFDECDREFVDQWTQSQMFELYCDWVTCN